MTTPSTVVGTLELLPAPCTTEPCLPAMVLAITTAGERYFLTQNGAFRTIDAAPLTLSPGSPVTARGITNHRRDINGKPFTAFDFNDLKAAN